MHLDCFQYRFQQKLGLRPRYQHIPGYPERQGPELTLTQNIGHGFPLLPAGKKSQKLIFTGGGHLLFHGQIHLCPAHRKTVPQQKLYIRGGIGYTDTL